MAKYSVLIPIAGHIRVEVEADSEEAAIQAALESDDTHLGNIDDWQAVESFMEGNVSYCPRPWQAEATLEDE
jgi:hypothetical protein